MSSLFVRPSTIVSRLRDRFDYIRTKHPTFPAVKILAATDSDLAEYLGDSDCTNPSETTLYVGGGLSVGTLQTSAGPAMSNVTTGITIILCIGTADEHAKIADELAIAIKEAVVVSLHGWQWAENRTPMYFVTDSIVKVKGNAILIRSYEFQHDVQVAYTDIDDAFDLFDNLDEFLQLDTQIDAEAAPADDVATIDSIATFAGT
jgi:hypothetical protein